MAKPKLNALVSLIPVMRGITNCPRPHLFHLFKKLICAIMLLAIAFSCFAFAGCAATKILYADYNGDYGEYEPLELVMNAGDTYTVTASHFRGLDIEFDKFEFIDNSRNNPQIFNPNAVTMSGNVITARHNGFVNVYADLYEKEVVLRIKHAWCVLVAQIQVINIDEMTEITTAQELQDMNLDLDGNYILVADIDLEGFEWEPIWNYVPNENHRISSFRGSFINPNGYIIRNLTSTGGLFAMTFGAYVDGIILENVDIDSASVYYDDTGIESMTVSSGIIGYAYDTIIANCKVDGTIKARNRAGGIAGNVGFGVIRNCEFNGTVIAEYQGEAPYWASAGGVAGEAYIFSYNNPSFWDKLFSDMLGEYKYLKAGIFDCTVNAEIISKDFAGGIIGYNYGDSKPENCIFVGTTQGGLGQGEMYGYSRH